MRLDPVFFPQIFPLPSLASFRSGAPSLPSFSALWHSKVGRRRHDLVVSLSSYMSHSAQKSLSCSCRLSVFFFDLFPSFSRLREIRALFPSVKLLPERSIDLSFPPCRLILCVEGSLSLFCSDRRVPFLFSSFMFSRPWHGS